MSNRPAKPPLKRRLRRRDSVELFARIVAADFSCPRCDWTTRLRSQAAGGWSKLPTRRSEKVADSRDRTWDPRLSRFHCGNCGLVLYLGIVAWPALQAAALAPMDTVPSYRQALALRRRLSRLAEERRRGADGVNALGEAQEGEADRNAWVWRRQAEKARELELLEQAEAQAERERWEKACGEDGEDPT